MSDGSYYGSRLPNCRRCVMCGTEWPYDPIKMKLRKGGREQAVGFAQCPCGGETKPYRTRDELMTTEEARSNLKHFMFESYYEAHDSRRTGASPDEIGREEGRVQAAQDQQAWREIRELRKLWDLEPGEEPTL